MDNTINLDLFHPHVGSTFTVATAEEETRDLELIEAKPLKTNPGAPRQDAFSLMFRGPIDLYFPQNTYAVSHPRLGTVHLFLVPRQPDEEGTYFEAIFN